EITSDYQDKTPIMIGILNGAFMFLSDLSKHIDLPLEILFIKVASYESMTSTGTVRFLIGLEKDLEGKDVIIVEDIIDTGLSMNYILELIQEKNPNSVQVVSLLMKPDSLKQDVSANYVGFQIPDKFVVGYGLDFEGFGRNLKQIY